MKKAKRSRQALETAVHGVFLLLGLITVGCVLAKIGRASCRERV